MPLYQTPACCLRGRKWLIPMIVLLASVSTPRPASAVVYYSLNFTPNTTNYQWLGCIDYWGYLIPNAQYSVTMNSVSNSNSHLHPNTPGHPVSTISPAQGTVASNGQTQVTIYTTLIGQDEYAQISCSKSGYTTVPSNNYFTVGYPDVYYNNHPDRMVNIGATAAHGGADYNRYMTTLAAYGIYDTVGAYLTLYSLQGQQVGANDQALPYGGIFDLNSNWWYPHDYHHRGTAADIRGNTNPYNVPVSRQDAFIDLCRQHGAELWQVEYKSPGDNDTSVANTNRHIHCHWPLIP